MDPRQTFAGDDSTNHLRSQFLWTERLLLIVLFLAGLLLFTVNLGDLPLHDWDEATVAQVAREIFQDPFSSDRWLFPTLWGDPYLNKPPLVHDFIALFYGIGGVNETFSRLPSGLLMAISVPMFYQLGRELFFTRQPALISALVYLTTLPLVRYGRFAMLEGAIICFTVLLFWSVLRSRRDLRWCLGVGLSLSLIGLTKGMMAILMGGIALVFLAWDTPRLLRSFYFWAGLALGLIPVLAWYGMQWHRYADEFIETTVWSQSLERIWKPVDNNRGPPWFYLKELVEFLPWLMFSFFGLHLAWQERIWGWAKLTLTWSGIYLIVVSIMTTKLPWYILPLYPALALAVGEILNQVLHYPRQFFYVRVWGSFLLALGIVGMGGSFYYGLVEEFKFQLVIICAAVALTTLVSGILVLQRDRQFISVLIWGMYVSLLLFVSSDYWLWELNESYPVKPVAMLIQQQVSKSSSVYTSYPHQRPSLNFYAGMPVKPASNEQLQNYWQENYFLLVDQATLKELNVLKQNPAEHYQAPPHWHLIRNRTARTN